VTEEHPIHQAYADALDAGGPAVIDLGRTVLCDNDSTDLTDDPRSGDAARQAEVDAQVAEARRTAAGNAIAGGAGYEWRREFLDNDQPDPYLGAIAAEHVQEYEPEPKPRCDRCGYLVIRCACPGGTR
jgi:hypothetical protein